MKLTCTQMYLFDTMAVKYLGKRGWGLLVDVHMKDVFTAMVQNGATYLEFGAMAEQFEEFSALLREHQST